MARTLSARLVTGAMALAIALGSACAPAPVPGVLRPPPGEPSPLPSPPGRPAETILRSLYDRSRIDTGRSTLRVGVATGANVAWVSSDLGLKITLEDVEVETILVPARSLARIGIQPAAPRSPTYASPGNMGGAVLVFSRVVLEVAVPGRRPAEIRGPVRVEPMPGAQSPILLKTEGGAGATTNGTGRPYPGALWLVPGWDGRLTVANEVDLEIYLEGLVPYEIFPSSPVEALKAQAVAARGQVLAKLGVRHLSDPFDLCAEVHCQVYRGLPPNGASLERVRLAVRETRGEVLTRGGQVVDTVYSANCGGHLEANENVWEGAPDPSLRGGFDGPVPPPTGQNDLSREENFRRWVQDAPQTWCGRATLCKPETFRWSQSVPADEMGARVAATYPDLGRVRDIVVRSRDSSGRASSVEIVGEKGRVAVAGELAIRQVFGGLKSSAFAVTVVREKQKKKKVKGKEVRKPIEFIFTGAGWGHGVGMCQTGAVGMAEAGYSYREILGHYFPGTDLSLLP